jgi:hypothetical protein
MYSLQAASYSTRRPCAGVWRHVKCGDGGRLSQNLAPVKSWMMTINQLSTAEGVGSRRCAVSVPCASIPCALNRFFSIPN